MNRRPILVICLSLVFYILSFGQQLQPGFDKAEYKELMLISARSTASEDYAKDFEKPVDFSMIYQSQPIGLDNMWDLWISEDKRAVVSIRGTTEKQESWLANFYAAMVPAKGSLRINGSETFEYHLATNPKAAVHVGWLLSTAYLSKEVIPAIQSQYKSGVRNILIMGHSQGGAIAFLLTSHLYHLQALGELPADIRFKTYCSAGPKPGNLYYAYEYEAITQGGWGYNVVNAADWVPEMPMSIQTLNDFNNINPFTNAKELINKQKVPNRIAMRYIYNQLDKPTRKAQRNYQKYLGNMTSKIIGKNIEGFEPPLYYSSNHYVRTGSTIVLMPDDEYYSIFPDDPKVLFPHHFHKPYLYLLDKLPASEQPSAYVSGIIYTPSSAEIAKADKMIKPIVPNKKVFIHSKLGIQLPGLDALNTSLTDNGFLKLNSMYLARGGGFYTIFPKIRLASLFNFSTFSGTNSVGSQTNALRGTTVGTSLGYSALRSQSVQLIPFGGVVYSWFGLRLSQQQTGDGTFNGYVGSGLNQIHIANQGFTGNLGVHFAAMPFPDKKWGKDLILGLRTGYFIPLKETIWNTNGATLQNGPNVNSHGFYAHFIFGVAI